MATTQTLDSNRVAGERIDQVGMVAGTFAVAAVTYATPTGITVDISAELTRLKIAHADVVRIVGRTTAGHMAVFTKTATTGQFTVRLWNGTTEASDGSTTVTLVFELFFTKGAES